jgi:hypothetical protein
MGWDSSRPVPWQRMVREWLLYVAIMLVILLVFFREQSLTGIVAGLLVSGPLYLGFGYLMAKLGYRRKSWRELRETSAAESATDATSRSSASVSNRPKPVPTSRTGGSSARPGPKRKRR